MNENVELYAKYLDMYYNYLINESNASIENYSKDNMLTIEFVTAMNDVILSFEDEIFMENIINKNRTEEF